MQIEFYLPLPPDGFWAALIIYYIVGLAVTFYCIFKFDIEPSDSETWRDLGLMGVILVLVAALVWPPMIIYYYRNR